MDLVPQLIFGRFVQVINHRVNEFVGSSIL